jgi:hypothetical protein
MGGASLAELFGRFGAICDEIAFHPQSHKAPNIDALVAEASAGD